MSCGKVCIKEGKNLLLQKATVIDRAQVVKNLPLRGLLLTVINAFEEREQPIPHGIGVNQLQDDRQNQMPHAGGLTGIQLCHLCKELLRNAGLRLRVTAERFDRVQPVLLRERVTVLFVNREQLQHRVIIRQNNLFLIQPAPATEQVDQVGQVLHRRQTQRREVFHCVFGKEQEFAPQGIVPVE